MPLLQVPAPLPSVKDSLKAKDLPRCGGVGTRLDSAFGFTRLERPGPRTRQAANMEG